MNFRAAAFLTRSIRQDSRLASHHLLRAAMALLILYLFAMEWTTFSSKPAVGALFASTVMMCCYWFLTLVGGLHFSTAIVEEKEEQTLPLLKMTGASAFTILAGKSLPRLFVAILFLLVVAPFLILSLTLGGVLPLGLLSAILSILCYAVMLSQLGLFASVICNTAQRAFTVTAVLWALIEFANFWAMLALGLMSEVLGERLLADTLKELQLPLSQCSLIGNLNATLLAFSPSDIWQTHMTCQLAIGGFFFLLSWVLFERCTSRATAEGPVQTTAIVTSDTGRSRVWPNALAWKSWQHLTGGQPWIWIRTIVIPVFISIFLYFIFRSLSWRANVSDVLPVVIFLGICGFLVNVARLFGLVLNKEIQDKTLASLVMLPQSTSDTVWSMIIGLLPAIASAATTAAFGFAALVFVESGRSSSSLSDLVEAMIEPWFWHLFSWVLLTVFLGLRLSTQLRYGSMILAAVLLWIVTPMLCMTSLAALTCGGGFNGGPGTEGIFRYIVPLALIATELLVCAALQQSTVRRIEVLAGE